MSIFIDEIGYNILDLGFDKSLIKNNSLQTTPELINVITQGIAPKNVTSGEVISDLEQAVGVLFNGKTAFDNTETGYRLGIDEADGLMKFYIGNTTDYLNWTGTELIIVGGVSIDLLDIGGSDATSFHVDVDGNMWMGAATFAVAPFKVSSAGALTATGVTITGTITATSGAIGGWTINSTSIYTGTEDFAAYTANAGDMTIYSDGSNSSIHAFNFYIDAGGDFHTRGGDITGVSIAGIPNNTSTDISLMECSHNLVFSVTDADTIAWATGTIIFSNARTFTIDAGNTGNMVALTYIYLDPAVSSTVLQVTTTYSTAMGANKRLIGTAQNNTITANFVPYGAGQILIDGANIGALSIVAGNIAASTITAGKLTVSQLSAIAADLGTITAGTVTGATIQTASSGTRFVMTSSAFQGINASAAVIFEILLTGGDVGDVIMGDDATGSYAKWDNSAGTFDVFADNIPSASQGTFGGDGSDGALSASSGTTDIDLAGAKSVVKNYTLISLTGSAKLTFSNPHANGTLIILKSQGNVTLTASATIIDASGMGATGGTAVSQSSNGTTNGNNGTVGTTDFTMWSTGNGIKATADVGGTASAALTGAFTYKTTAESIYISKYFNAFVGSGGGSGAAGWTTGSDAGTVTSGGGGYGGGALIIECAGDWNYTTASGISVAGKVGTAPSQGGTTRASGGGGGGGGGGFFLALYNTLTANSGTVVVSGGAATGSVADYSAGPDTGMGGGSGGSGQTASSAGTNGGASTAGDGSAGTAGLALVVENTIFF